MTKYGLGAATLLAAATLGMAQTADAAILFADDFNDNDVSDWTIAPGSKGSTVVTVSGGVMETYFNAPASIGAGFAGAQHGFTLAGDATAVSLQLRARTAPCGGCTMRYQVLIDGALVINGTDQVFTPWNIALGDLAAGNHVIVLQHATNAASSGHFTAFFDYVTLQGTVNAVPEPASWALMIAGFGAVGAAMRRRPSQAFA